MVSETPPPPPRTCLPPASRFRLFGPVLASWPPSSRWLGQVRSQDCLSCVLPSICCAVRSTRATFFTTRTGRSPSPVPRSTRCHPKPARQQVHPGKQATLYSCRGSAEEFCKTTLESRAGSVFPALPTSTLSAHPLTAILASASTRSFLIFPMCHGRSASFPNPLGFLLSPFCNRIAWIACPAVRAETDHCSRRSSQHTDRRFRAPSRCLHQQATLTPLGTVSKKGPGRRSLSFRRFAGSSSCPARSFVRSPVRSLPVRYPPHQCALHGRLQLWTAPKRLPKTGYSL